MRATSTALNTDHYELTMLDAALRGGTAGRRTVFEVFARHLPEGRRYGVVAGTGRLLDGIQRFRFGDAELDWLRERDFLHGDTLAYLADYAFTGDLHGYREGELYFPGSPILSAHGTFAECVVLETLVLSVLNHDSAVASAASRMVTAAEDRPLMEFGSRRTHEDAAVAAARAACVAGFAATSNLEAGRRFGLPTLGTSAHAFTLLFDDEAAAFQAQVAALGTDTTLLVDTYDTFDGIERAVEAGGTELGGVRIDSGDLVEATRKARKVLDELGAEDTRIVLSGDLDEYRLEELQAAPADAYGVGTRVVTGSGAPTGDLVYKLVARSTTPDGPLEGVAKHSGRKATVASRKAAYRRLEDGVATEERIVPWRAAPPTETRALQVPLIEAGRRVHDPDLGAIRDHHRSAVAELPEAGRRLADGSAAIPTVRDLGATGGDSTDDDRDDRSQR